VAGTIINCPPRHERIEVLISAKESNGNVFRYNHYMEPKAGFQTEHIHMKQHEYYEVISGTAVYKEDGVEKFAKADRTFAMSGTEWDADPWLLNTLDGTVDLRTGDIRPAQQTDLITKIIGTSPGVGVSRVWSEFLKQITKGGDGMPAFDKKLTPEQMNDLIKMIRVEFQGK